MYMALSNPLSLQLHFLAARTPTHNAAVLLWRMAITQRGELLQQWPWQYIAHSRNVIVGFHSIRTTERKCIPFIRCSLQIPQKFIGIKTTRDAMAHSLNLYCVC